MKDKMIVKVFVIIGFFSLSQPKNQFMPNLPVGEFRVVFNKVYSCESKKHNSIQFNIFFNKKSLNLSELQGNITSSILFDDTLTLDFNLASWGSTGGWKPNSAMYITKKACSNMKNVAGNAWFSFVKGFNIPTDSCPLPPGTYSTSGIDLKKFEDHNFPKIYFYGKYKAVMNIKSSENKVLGCVVLELTLIRPWETPI